MGTKINLITYNVGNLDKEDLTEYILNDALSMFNEACQNKQQNLKSVIRRLFFAYDLLINGDLKN